MILTATDLLARYLEKTKDDTTANSNLGKERINTTISNLCDTHDFKKLRTSYQITSVASQQDYEVPVDISKISTVTATVGGKTYPVAMIDDPLAWDQMNVDNNVTSDYPTYYFYDEDVISLFPTQSSNGNTITIKYLRKPLPIVNWTEYATGTLAFTNGDTTVTGTTTNFLTGFTLNSNTHVVINGIAYRVESVTDATHLELSKAYQGTTTSGVTTRIADIPVINESFVDLCWTIPAKEYYMLNKENGEQAKMLSAFQSDLEYRLKTSENSKTIRKVIQRQRYHIRSINDYPESIGV